MAALFVAAPPALLPIPRQVVTRGGEFVLRERAHVVYEDPLLGAHAKVLARELGVLTGVDVQPAQGPAVAGDVSLRLDAGLKGEHHRLDVGEQVVASGGDAHAVTLATATLLQALDGTRAPRMVVDDEPRSPYRGMLIDVARQFHTLDTLEQAIELARLYKVRYLQMHLTDDSSFTFESKRYPALATPGRNYTQEQLRALVAYAQARGVTLVPELDLPGHSTEMRRRMPELFGAPDLGVIDIASPAAVGAVKELIREIIDVFGPSPYFHIGADEVWLAKLAERPSPGEAVKARGFDGVHDLYLAAIAWMHAAVKGAGRQTLMWESFAGTGSRAVSIPKDVLVMAWETAYQRPESLLANGYQIINASWKPTYVTPGIQWTPKEIYAWNIFRWENWVRGMPSYNPIQIEPTDRVLGAQFNAWEMADEMTLPAARIRLPAVCERAWNPQRTVPYAEFQRRLDATDRVFQRLTLPVMVEAQGLVDPGYVGGVRNREHVFGDVLTVTMRPARAGLVTRFTLDGTVPGADAALADAPLAFHATTRLRIQAFDAAGNRVGHVQTVEYEFEPLQAEVLGLIDTTRHEHPAQPRTQFADAVRIAMRTLRPGRVRATVDGSAPTVDSEPVVRAIVLDRSATVRARLFDDAGAAVGREWRRDFVKVPFEPSLSTGKPVTVSGSESGSDPGTAVDGLIDVDQHWGGAPAPQWLSVDLGAAVDVARVHLTTHWDGNRSYRYRIDTSVDGRVWRLAADASGNTLVATASGVQHPFAVRRARYVRVTMLGNTANPAVHIVELAVFGSVRFGSARACSPPCIRAARCESGAGVAATSRLGKGDEQARALQIVVTARASGRRTVGSRRG